MFYIKQHNIKKIRNNIHKSNKTGQPRCLKIGGKSITWKQFRNAFDWDQHSFSLPLHEKLTIQHLDLDSASIMRNKLAEDVLDTKMLFLMQVIIYSCLIRFKMYMICLLEEIIYICKYPRYTTLSAN